MKLKRAEARPPTETIVALIDVIFFLLVFFMLVGRMDATAPFEVLPPIATVGAPMPKGGTTISLSVDGRLALDGVEMARAPLIDAVATAPGAMVRVNADAAAELRRLLPLVAELEAIPNKEVVLVVTPEPQ
ncbi:MAG: biopolymer transporter ExbD [Pseudomonadota bacterium]